MRYPKASLYGLLGGLLMGAAIAFMSGNAQAGSINYPSAGTLSPNPLATASVSGSNIVWASPINQLITSGRQPVTINMVASRTVTAAAAAKLVQRVAAGSLQGLVVQAAIRAAVNAAGYECDLSGCRTLPVAASTISAQSPTQVSVWKVSAPGYTNGAYGSYPAASYTPAQACAASGPSWAYGGDGKCWLGYTWVGSVQGTIGYTYACPSGYTQNGTVCNRAAVPGQPIDDGQFASNVYQGLPDGLKTDTLQQAVNAGDPVAAGPNVMSGPASVTSPSQTTTVFNSTNNQTTVTTNTTTVNNSYSGSTYNYSVTNNSSSTVNGVPSETETEQAADDPDDQAQVVDTDMPAQPTLYMRKYPDGIQGVWNTRSAEMKATPLFGLSAIFNPTVGSGSCPSWTFNANIGPHMNFGQGVISPPCWLWPLLKAVIIITALLISRRLVFGG